MKKMILSLVAASALGLATGAAAQPGDHHDRTVVRTTHTTVVHRAAARHHRRTCQTVWRHHKRVRTCHTW